MKIGTILILLSGCVLIYVLYINGYLVTQAKSALVYRSSFRNSRKRDSASFTLCSGFTKRVIRFPESRSYWFTLNSGVSKGSLSIEIQNKERQSLLTLDGKNNSGRLSVDRKSRYFLVVRFDRADGHYELNWS